MQILASPSLSRNHLSLLFQRLRATPMLTPSQLPSGDANFGTIHWRHPRERCSHYQTGPMSMQSFTHDTDSAYFSLPSNRVYDSVDAFWWCRCQCRPLTLPLLLMRTAALASFDDDSKNLWSLSSPWLRIWR